jgi:NAD(P)-dependent dehydrogenase (short-subunit alcohol dehydrogenase family)
MSKKWTPESIPDLTGRTYVVTGATSGLGLVSAAEFAGHGGRVIVTGRNPAKLTQATERVSAAATHAPPESVRMDLASLASIHDAATQIAGLTSRVDVLLNNAGVMATPHEVTEDGFELQIGTNHLGHFALTGLLLPLLHHQESTTESSGRVVTVASLAHKNARVATEDLFFETREYQPWLAYGQSKLANLLFSSELARRAQAAGWSLISVAAHPGVSATNLFDGDSSATRNPLSKVGNKAVESLISQSAEEGAQPLLYAATAPDVASGAYYGPDGLFEIRGKPKQVSPNASARNPKRAAELWAISEELTGVTYDFEG